MTHGMIATPRTERERAAQKRGSGEHVLRRAPEKSSSEGRSNARGAGRTSRHERAQYPVTGARAEPATEGHGTPSGRGTAAKGRRSRPLPLTRRPVATAKDIAR